MLNKDKKAKVYISYAGGNIDSNDPIEKEREELVNKIEEALKKDFDVERDKSTLERGKSIPEFMKKIGEGEFVVVVISEKYLTESEYTLKEIRYLVRNSRLEDRVYIVMTKYAPDIFESKEDKERILKDARNTINKRIDAIVEKIDDPDEEDILNECIKELERFLKKIKTLKNYDHSDESIVELVSTLKKDTNKNESTKFTKKTNTDKYSIGIVGIVAMVAMVGIIALNNYTGPIYSPKITYEDNNTYADLGEPTSPKLNLNTFLKEVKIKLKKAENFIKSGDYNKSREIYQTILKQKLNLSTENRMEVYRQLVRLDKKQKDWKNAIVSSNDYISFLESFNKKDYSLDIAHAYRNKGKIYFNLDKYKKARKFFEYSKKKYQEYHKKPHEHVLWVANWIGDTYEEENNYKDANKTLSQSLNLALQLNQTDSIRYKKNIPWVYARLAYAQDRLGDITQSKENYKQAITWYEKLDNNLSKYDSDKSWIFRNLGHIYTKEKNYIEALKYYKKAIKLYKKLEYYVDVAHTYYSMYGVYWNLGEKYNKEAKKTLNNSLEWYKKANKKYKTNKYDINIGKTYTDLGWFYQHRDINASDKIIENYITGIETKKRLEPKKYLIDVVLSQRDLANYYFNKQEYDNAEKIYKESLENCKIVVNEYNQTKYAKELAWTYHDVGASINGQKNSNMGGLPFFKKSLEMYEQYNLINISGYQLTLSALQYIYNEQKNSKEVENTSKKLLKYYENKDKNATWDKAFQNYIIGSSKRGQGKKEALYYLDKSLMMLEKIKHKDKFFENFIPSVITFKIQYYLDFNEIEKAKDTYKELNKHTIPKDIQLYVDLLDTQINKNFTKESLKQVFNKAPELKTLGYIFDLTLRAEEFYKENKLNQAIQVYLQAYRLALKAFKKEPNIYQTTFSIIVVNMVEANMNGQWREEIDSTISLLKEQGYANTLEMAKLKLLKARYKLIRLSKDDDIKTLLNEALHIFQKNSQSKINDKKICYINYYLGEYAHSKLDYAHAEKYYLETLKCAKNKKYDQLIFNVNNMLKNLYDKQGLYSMAIDKQLDSIKLYKTYILKKEKDLYAYQLTSLYNDLLPSYIKNMDIDGFNKRYIELEKTSENIVKKRSEELIGRINNLVEIFEETKQYKEAIDFIMRNLNNYDNLLKRNLFYIKLGDLYEKTNDLVKSKKYYEKVLPSYRNIMKDSKENNVEKIYIDLTNKEIEELERCINSKTPCHRQEYVMCTTKNANGDSKEKVIRESECVDESAIVYDSETKVYTHVNVFNNLGFDANDELFEKYGVEINNTMTDVAEPVR